MLDARRNAASFQLGGYENAALRLKFGSCQRMSPPKVIESRCRAVLVVELQCFLAIGRYAQVQKV